MGETDQEPLSPRMALFVQEYLIDRNGKQAAIRAGYSAKTAEQAASRLLRNVKVARAVRKADAERSERVALTQDWVIERLIQNQKDAAASRQYAAANKALELLGKHQGMFSDQNVNLRTPDGPLEIRVTRKVVRPDAG